MAFDSMSYANAPAHANPSFEDSIEYLRQTVYAQVLADEFRERRESALRQLSTAADEREVWKIVGRVEEMDSLMGVFLGK